MMFYSLLLIQILFVKMYDLSSFYCNKKNEQVLPLMSGDTISPLTVDYTQTTGIDGNLPNQDIA